MMTVKQSLVRGVKQFVREKIPLAEAMYKVWTGNRALKKLRDIYGRDTHVFLMRGATGDTYMQLALMDDYRKKRNISSYKIVADSARCEELAELFRERNLIAMDTKWRVSKKRICCWGVNG